MHISPDQITQYLAVPYVDGGRDLNGWDCWGLVRHVLMTHAGISTIRSYSHIAPDNKSALTKAFYCEREQFEISKPCVGAVAAVFKGVGNKQLMIHVGVVIDDGGILKVLHTCRAAGSSKLPLRRFEANNSQVEYYAHYSRLSEHPR